MSDESLYNQVTNEMEKDGYDLIEQAMLLMFGGMFGGQAFQVAQENYSPIVEIIHYIVILTVAFASIGIIHLMMSYGRIKSEGE